MLNLNNSKNQIYAGFKVRAAASLIDVAITLPFFLVILHIAGIDLSQLLDLLQKIKNEELPRSDPTKKVVDFVNYVIAIAYSVYFVSSKTQATPGKRIMNIYIATIDNQKLSLNRCFARIVVTIILPFGFLMIPFTKEKTALHDIICKTRVFCGKQ